MKQKVCTKCGDKHPATLEYFPPRKNRKSKFHSWCRICCSKRSREYYQQHVMERRKYRKKYYQTLIGYLYAIFHAIDQRCNDPKNKRYKYYGGRGIELRFMFDEFADYVINKLQVDPRGLTIDRINNDGNYEKGNIRFVTQAENNKNKGHK